jgi:hypothetical protein
MKLCVPLKAKNSFVGDQLFGSQEGICSMDSDTIAIS